MNPSLAKRGESLPRHVLSRGEIFLINAVHNIQNTSFVDKVSNGVH